MCIRDSFMKCRYLDEITGNRGTVFATGTPVSNSMVELYSVQTVSYTHLDVYKRQEPELPLGRYALMHRDYLEKHKRVTYLNLLTSGRLNGHLHEVEPVSYTHLDVYKRQGQKCIR